jgi:hypothetical protein
MIAFWDITPCSLVGIYRRFRDAHCLHQRSRSISTNLRGAISQKSIIFSTYRAHETNLTLSNPVLPICALVNQYCLLPLCFVLLGLYCMNLTVDRDYCLSNRSNTMTFVTVKCYVFFGFRTKFSNRSCTDKSSYHFITIIWENLKMAKNNALYYINTLLCC